MKVLFVLLAGVIGMGCVEPPSAEEEGISEFRTVVFEAEERAPQISDELFGDRADDLAVQPTWSVKRDGVQLQIVTTLRPTWRDNMLRWELHGRMDPPPERLIGVDRLKNRHEAKFTDVAFVIELDEHTTLDLISGYALELEVSHNDQTQSGLVRFKPAFRAFAGTHAMWIYRWMHAIHTPEGRVFRARAGTKPGYSLESVWTDDDVEGLVRPDVSAGRWKVDFSPSDVLLASDFPDPVFFNVVDSDDTRTQKQGVVELRLTDLRLMPDRSRLANVDPLCSPDVLECLKTLEASATDTEQCGHVAAVEPCFDVRGTR